MVKPVRYEDVARLAGVSVATVSRALNNSADVNTQTRQRIWRIAQDAGYAFRPNMPVSVGDAERILSVVIPTPQGRVGALSDPFFSELVGAVAQAAHEAGADVMLHHATPRNYEELASLVEGSRADGTLLLGQSVLHEPLNRLAAGGAPFVVWGADLPGQGYASVGSDNIAGGRRATRHLLSLGRRSIAFLGDPEAPEIEQRQEGYAQALAEAGVDYAPTLSIPVRSDVTSAQAVVDGMIARGMEFDAIFAGSDLIALGAIEAVRRAGRSVPGDVSVVGYDDLGMARHARPRLTTVPQDLQEAGRLMVAKLLSARGPGDITSQRLRTELKVRESCGAG